MVSAEYPGGDGFDHPASFVASERGLLPDAVIGVETARAARRPRIGKRGFRKLPGRHSHIPVSLPALIGRLCQRARKLLRLSVIRHHTLMIRGDVAVGQQAISPRQAVGGSLAIAIGCPYRDDPQTLRGWGSCPLARAGKTAEALATLPSIRFQPPRRNSRVLECLGRWSE